MACKDSIIKMYSGRDGFLRVCAMAQAYTNEFGITTGVYLSNIWKFNAINLIPSQYKIIKVYENNNV